MTSLERIQQYMVIEQEPEPKDGGVPPAYWPSSGALDVEKLSARYSPVSLKFGAHTDIAEQNLIGWT